MHTTPKPTHIKFIIIYGSVTNKGWPDEQLKNIFKSDLKSSIAPFIFYFLPKVRLNPPENVKWCNHKRYLILYILSIYSVFKCTYTNNSIPLALFNMKSYNVRSCQTVWCMVLLRI